MVSLSSAVYIGSTSVELSTRSVGNNGIGSTLRQACVNK